MKIAAGGLQSLVNDVLPVKKIDFLAGQKKQESEQREAISSYAGVDRENLGKTVEKLNRATELFEQRISFKIHDETKRLMVRVIDDNTGEVIKEIPPEDMLDIEANISKMIGIILDKHA